MPNPQEPFDDGSSRATDFPRRTPAAVPSAWGANYNRISFAYRLIPAPALVLLRRLRYAYAQLCGCSRIAGEQIGVSWSRDWEVVRVVKHVAGAKPQVLRCDDEQRLLWRTEMGDFWAPEGSSPRFVSGLVIEALSDVYRFSRQKFRFPPIVIDAGANIGTFTRSALAQGAARVICLEPSPLTADCLELTFEPEIRSGRVTVLRKGAWERVEILHFRNGNRPNPGAHSVVSAPDEQTTTIQATTIDATVQELGLRRVDFIKMDIEGAEASALRGAFRTIGAFKPAIGMGTEHTADIAANNEAVIRIVREIEPSYRVECTEVHPVRSPSRGLALTPYSLSFVCPGPDNRDLQERYASAPAARLRIAAGRREDRE
jgi:FkbM family methyltransferase